MEFERDTVGRRKWKLTVRLQIGACNVVTARLGAAQFVRFSPHAACCRGLNGKITAAGPPRIGSASLTPAVGGRKEDQSLASVCFRLHRRCPPRANFPGVSVSSACLVGSLLHCCGQVETEVNCWRKEISAYVPRQTRRSHSGGRRFEPDQLHQSDIPRRRRARSALLFVRTLAGVGGIMQLSSSMTR